MADLPIAAIICIAVGLYVAVIIAIIILCYCLKGRGRCTGECNCCAKKEGAQSCECCIAMAEACNCCKGPSLNSCLDSCCPNRKRVTCVDIILCQCCASDGTTFCDCFGKCQRDNPETCNCLCLEIRMRSPRDKHTRDIKIPHSPVTNTRQAWISDPSLYFRAIPTLTDSSAPDGFQAWDSHRDDLQLDLGWFRNAAYPISTHPINTNRSETSGDFVPTSTPRFHQGQSQLFIRPGVHSAGRVIAKRQAGQWPTARRLLTRRRSSRHPRSPLTRSLQRRRPSRITANVRPIARKHSHRDQVLQWETDVE